MGPAVSFAPTLRTRVADLELLRRPEDLRCRAYRTAVRAALAGPRELRAPSLQEAAAQAFRELGHEAAVARCLGRRCLAAEHLHVAVELPPEGGSEGLVTAGVSWPIRRIEVRVAPERFLSDALRDLLLPELEIVEEMLDPAFGYAGGLQGAPAAVLALWRAHAALMLEEHGLLDAPRPSLSAMLSTHRPAGPADADAMIRKLARADLTCPELVAMAAAELPAAARGAAARSGP